VEQAPQIPLEIAQWLRTRTPDLQAFWNLENIVKWKSFGASNVLGEEEEGPQVKSVFDSYIEGPPILYDVCDDVCSWGPASSIS